MALNNTVIANQVLALLGVALIESIDAVDNRASQVKTLLPLTRQSQLRGHPWNFAMVRASLNAFTTENATMTPGAGATVAGTTGVTFTAGSAVFGAVDVGRRIWNTSGSGKATITGFSTSTVVTCTIDEAFPSLALIPAGSWRLYFSKPAHTYLHKVPVPSGYLRTHDKDNTKTQKYKREGQFFITNEETLELTYVGDIPDPTTWPPDFEDAIVYMLAAKLAFPVAQNLQLMQQYAAMAQMALAAARSFDAQEGTPDSVGTNILGVVRRTHGGLLSPELRPLRIIS